MGKLMVSLVISHTDATRIGWHLWEIDLRFAPGLPPRWLNPPHSEGYRDRGILNSGSFFSGCTGNGLILLNVFIDRF
jgi:hypothetical protein